MNSSKMIWTIIILVLALGGMAFSFLSWNNTRKMCKAVAPKAAPEMDVEPETDEPAE